MKRLALPLALAMTLAAPLTGQAQGGPGFLFSRPKVSLGIRTGYALPRLSSQIFDFSRQEFTLNRFDFDAPYLGGEFAFRLAEQWDIAISAGWSESNGKSEYRNWVDMDELPIEQETRFQNTSVSLGVRYYFTERGRTVGRFAWVPSRLTPFVGAGVGVAAYEFTQWGDFVDFQTLDIVYDELESTGSGAAAWAGLGADLSIGKQFYLTGEARYTMAGGEMSGPYAAYDGIDLSGLQVTVGLSARW